jgi:rhamnosyltransferase
MKNRPCVIAVVVTYYPVIATFLSLLEQLMLQTDGVVVVDNSDREDNHVLDGIPGHYLDSGRLSVACLGENQGIATALNIGIEEAMRGGAQYVLLSDQDSLPDTDMVERLMSVQERLASQGVRVGAVGPTFVNLHTGKRVPFQVQLPGRAFYGEKHPNLDEQNIEVLSLITSGSLIQTSIFRDVGLMREEYFIDKVDIEWCFRARASKYRLFGTGRAHMYQRLGDGGVKVWFFGWHDVSLYSPLRVYYQVRNYVAMCRLDYVDWKWKLKKGWFTLGIVYSQGVFGKMRGKVCLMGFLGLWHGIVNRMGRYG